MHIVSRNLALEKYFLGHSNCTIVTTSDFSSVVSFQETIPEFSGQYDSSSDVCFRGEHLNGVVFKAVVKEEFVGLLFAYQCKEHLWYNHITAVLPAFRKMGIAQSLIETFEKYAKDKDAKGVSVKSKNAFPQMLRLLIANGYKIEGTEGDKILFLKEFENIQK